MNVLSRLVLAALLALSSVGCGRYYEFGQVNTNGRGRGEFAFIAPVYSRGFGSGIALVSTGSDPAPEPTYVTNVYYVNGATPARPVPQRPSAEREPRAADLPSFDPHAARRSLASIEVGSCVAAGATRGFGHAKVTMNPDGRISKVVIDEPAGLSAEAAKCIGDRLGTATIPPFKGSLVTVGTTFHVR